MLPDFSPAKLSNLVWRAVDREGNILVSDMGRLSMHIMEQALKHPDARLLGGTSTNIHIKQNVDSVYHLDRPERSLQLTMQDVVFNDKDMHLMDVYRGPFFDFKKYLGTILENNR